MRMRKSDTQTVNYKSRSMDRQRALWKMLGKKTETCLILIDAHMKTIFKEDIST